MVNEISKTEDFRFINKDNNPINQYKKLQTIKGYIDFNAPKHLIEKLNKIKSNNESDLHLGMKLWIATEFVNKGISMDNIYFERTQSNKGHYVRPDVFIDISDKIGIYCQSYINITWINDIIRKQLFNYFDRVIIVYPHILTNPNLYLLKEQGFDLQRFMYV